MFTLFQIFPKYLPIYFFQILTMKEETHQAPKKNSFQLELEAKMKERHARGLTTALSPSPTDFNQDSIVISDGEDGKLIFDALRSSKLLISSLLLFM